MRMHIANCSEQNQVLNYRLPEETKVRTQNLAIGRQIYIGDGDRDMTEPQISAVADQLGTFGLVHIKDLSRARGIIPYVWSDSIIAADVILRVDQHNKGVLEGRGKLFREQAAIASNSTMENAGPLNALEMSVEEDTSGSFKSTDHKPVAEGFRRDVAA